MVGMISRLWDPQVPGYSWGETVSVFLYCRNRKIRRPKKVAGEVPLARGEETPQRDLRRHPKEE
jgi:hypothetical protein